MRLTPRGRRLADTAAVLALGAAFWTVILACYVIGTR